MRKSKWIILHWFFVYLIGRVAWRRNECTCMDCLREALVELSILHVKRRKKAWKFSPTETLCKKVSIIWFNNVRFLFFMTKKISKTLKRKLDTDQSNHDAWSYATYNVLSMSTWWLFLASVTTYPSLVILRPQQRLTFTYGHSNSLIIVPSRENTATWKRLPWLSPTNTSPIGIVNLQDPIQKLKDDKKYWPASLTSIPFGKLVIFSPPMRLTKSPSSLNTTTQWPLNQKLCKEFCSLN